ncbi:helix-turn-helix transcriptional regulator [Myxococcaceae bacterium JPH2]|nr:helix-turn-helix transcriptional regulator [Myxococcaceae bacterium JPH2]
MLGSPRTQTAPHRQWGTALLVGLDDVVTVRHAEGTTRGRIVVVPRDVPHVTRCEGPLLSVVLDADRHRATVQASLPSQPFAITDPAVLAEAVSLAAHPSHDTPRRAEALAARLFPTGPAPVGDGRIARLLDTLEDSEPRSLVELARGLRLSPGHVSELFHARVGISLRRWLLWRRLLRSLPLFRAGHLADTAASAGFADQAHLTRTCVRLAGYSPRSLANMLAR